MNAKKVFAGVSAAVLCASPTIASADQIAGYTTASVIQAPLGATGMLHIRLPIGSATRSHEPTLGLSFGFGELTAVGNAGEYQTHEVRLAELRFNTRGDLQRLEAVSFDLAHLDQDQRFDGLGGQDSTLLIVVGLVAVGAVALLASSSGDEDSSSSPDFNYAYN